MTTAAKAPAAPPEAGLYRKLAEVVLAVEGVAKDGRNDFHKYDYTTAEALLRALRKPLAERQVALLCSLTDIGEREITTKKGDASTITTVRVQFTFVDGDTGHMHACEWAGQGDDPADKGLGKAYTNAIKTFLREQFLIPQGDDPEADRRTDERAAQRAPGNGNGQHGMTARPTEPTRKLANGGQKGKINARAKERQLSGLELLNIIRAVAGAAEPLQLEPEEAQAKLRKAIDRLPADLVDPVLEAIATAAEPEEIPF